MSNFNQNQAPVSYPPPAAYSSSGPYVAPPPPVGYPTNNSGPQNNDPNFSPETKSRGDGFWKGCCAAVCCCCALDICF